MLQALQKYVHLNAHQLFNYDQSEPLKAMFGKRGFTLSTVALTNYSMIKNLPHLYVAFTDQPEGFYYIGKSNQRGGRWRSGHYYHLGTLAHHLLNTVKPKEQNHQHWIDSWMKAETAQIIQEPFSISLKSNTFISFIPFANYSTIPMASLSKKEISDINTTVERELIDKYRQDGYTLLNR